MYYQSANRDQSRTQNLKVLSTVNEIRNWIVREQGKRIDHQTTTNPNIYLPTNEPLVWHSGHVAGSQRCDWGSILYGRIYSFCSLS